MLETLSGLKDVPLMRPEEVRRLPAFVTDVLGQTNACKRDHGCVIKPFEHGELLSVIVAATRPRRILELGTGLGYSTLWMAHGHEEALIDTIEGDPVHIEAAWANFRKYGISTRVALHEMEFLDALPRLDDATYDLVMFDGWEPEISFLAEFERLVRPGGVLVTSNMFFGNDEVREYARLLATGKWRTGAIAADASTVMSVRDTALER